MGEEEAFAVVDALVVNVNHEEGETVVHEPPNLSEAKLGGGALIKNEKI